MMTLVETLTENDEKLNIIKKVVFRLLLTLPHTQCFKLENTVKTFGTLFQ